MNGIATFKHLVHGWQLINFVSSDYLTMYRRIEINCGRLLVMGDFAKVPKLGFCQRPHKLVYGN